MGTENPETKTCLKCFECRITFEKPEGPDRLEESLTDPERIGTVFCRKGVFDQTFESLAEFKTSSVRRRAKNCPYYDADEETEYSFPEPSGVVGYFDLGPDGETINLQIVREGSCSTEP